MDSPLELVQFVVRSRNRVTALRALSSEPRSRPDLQAETGVPRATLSRILGDFRRRDLAAREGHAYRTTPLGDLFATELGALVEAVGTMQELQTVAPWLPLEDLDTDLADLRDARVTLPTQADPFAPMRRAASLLEGVERVRMLCYSVVHEPVVAEWRAITERGQRFEGVVATDTLDAISADPRTAERMAEVIAAENATLFVHEGSVPYQLTVADGTVLLVAIDETGAIQGLVETDDGGVRSWAERTIDAYRSEAEAVGPGALAP